MIFDRRPYTIILGLFAIVIIIAACIMIFHRRLSPSYYHLNRVASPVVDRRRMFVVGVLPPDGVLYTTNSGVLKLCNIVTLKPVWKLGSPAADALPENLNRISVGKRFLMFDLGRLWFSAQRQEVVGDAVDDYWGKRGRMYGSAWGVWSVPDGRRVIRLPDSLMFAPLDKSGANELPGLPPIPSIKPGNLKDEREEYLKIAKFIPHSSLILAACGGRLLATFDCLTGRLVQEIKLKWPHWPRSEPSTSTGNINVALPQIVVLPSNVGDIAAIGAGSSIIVLRTHPLGVLRVIALPLGSRVTAMAFSADGERLMVIGKQGFLSLFNPHTGRQLVARRFAGGTPCAVCFSNNGKWLFLLTRNIGLDFSYPGIFSHTVILRALKIATLQDVTDTKSFRETWDPAVGITLGVYPWRKRGVIVWNGTSIFAVNLRKADAG